MVIRLQRPEFDDMDIIEKIVEQRLAGRNATYFLGIRDQWKQRVHDYINAAGSPEVIRPWARAVDFKKRFLSLYNSPQPDSIQKPLLEKLRERVLQLCPACGEDGTPNTLDHYLPKNDFPDFAVAAVNLFPMCDTCQGIKLEKILSSDGERLFIHPYFDVFLDRQVLQLTIGEPYTAPESMRLSASDSLEEYAASLVSRHISSLNLNNRYYHFFREQYTHLLNSAADIREAGLNMRQQLTLFQNKARRKSINSWGHVFYSSVLANEDLINYLEAADLPSLEEWARPANLAT